METTIEDINFYSHQAVAGGRYAQYKFINNER